MENGGRHQTGEEQGLEQAILGFSRGNYPTPEDCVGLDDN